ncbi:GntR family transcriptional regulator [Streptomyces sp. NA04227]|uniref:GntR family transcriptional regulator n=1 Tax=Streptomyces sp. NA04227 TaxID=2742136 RepID=UPI00159042E3|nr:GntR family transcriptional regulator [Streptomyces sp. NA04227]QKW08559.1 GntR family transcriptional regulator [Streptomyces sp. NA04227]
MEGLRQNITSEEIAATIRADIEAGTYRPGDRLPEAKEMARGLRLLVPRSVDLAYGLLVAEGTLEQGPPGLPPVVADPTEDPRVRELRATVRELQGQVRRLDETVEELTRRTRALERGLRETRAELLRRA